MLVSLDMLSTQPYHVTPGWSGRQTATKVEQCVLRVTDREAYRLYIEWHDLHMTCYGTSSRLPGVKQTRTMWVSWRIATVAAVAEVGWWRRRPPASASRRVSQAAGGLATGARCRPGRRRSSRRWACRTSTPWTPSPRGRPTRESPLGSGEAYNMRRDQGHDEGSG